MVNVLLKLLIIIFMLFPVTTYSRDFFEQRYRGWLWFEEQERQQARVEEKKRLEEELIKKQQYEKARAEIEQFAKELEELKYMMMRHPDNVEHVRAYRQKEAQMFNNAISLAQTDRIMNFLYPEDFNLIDRPQNLYGRRIKAEIIEKNNQERIMAFAGEVELFLFFSSECPYCQQLEPVLADFIKKYGFKCEAISLDGQDSSYFKTHHDKGLVKHLGLKETPTIVAVTNDSDVRFELLRGAASFAELEEVSLLGVKYLEQLRGLKLSEHEKLKN